MQMLSCRWMLECLLLRCGGCRPGERLIMQETEPQVRAATSAHGASRNLRRVELEVDPASLQDPGLVLLSPSNGSGAASLKAVLVASVQSLDAQQQMRRELVDGPMMRPCARIWKPTAPVPCKVRCQQSGSRDAG